MKRKRHIVVPKVIIVRMVFFVAMKHRFWKSIRERKKYHLEQNLDHQCRDFQPGIGPKMMYSQWFLPLRQYVWLISTIATPVPPPPPQSKANKDNISHAWRKGKKDYTFAVTWESLLHLKWKTIYRKSPFSNAAMNLKKIDLRNDVELWVHI